MKRVIPGLAALLICSTASATPVRFETDVTITGLTGDYLTMFGDVAVGDRVLIQVEADNSTPRHRIDYRLYFGGRLHELSFPDWSGTGAQVDKTPAIFDIGNLIVVGSNEIAPHSDMGGYWYQWGYYDRRNPSGCDYECCKSGGIFEHCDYWEGAYNYFRETFRPSFFLPDGSGVWSLDDIYDLADPMLYSVGSYSITYSSKDCGSYEAYGCLVAAPPAYGFGRFDASVSWEGHVIRRGWTDMTATVSAGPLAPLFGLLLWIGVRRRK
ncbi:MAG: hypothetical protein II007_13450 [Gammaproteobacteria bacterium]|nr:hypothetical protein [Gammaproteobacteria bacterium]